MKLINNSSIAKKINYSKTKMKKESIKEEFINLIFPIIIIQIKK
jgi:hypothetical protein